jgi:membrane protease subunit (stomatin/prohibitin family)
MPSTQPARPFITPEPKVKVNPNTYQWKCPRCAKRNDEGDTTCMHCGQDVEIHNAH